MSIHKEHALADISDRDGGIGFILCKNLLNPSFHGRASVRRCCQLVKHKLMKEMCPVKEIQTQREVVDVIKCIS